MTKQVRQAITPTHILGSTGTAESDTLGYRTLANIKGDLGLGTSLTVTANNGAGSAGDPAFSFTGDPDTGIFNPSADTLAFSTNGTEKMRITSAGNVGIGTTSPNDTLQVTRASGTAKISVTSSSLANGQEATLGAFSGSGVALLGIFKHSGITNPCAFLDLKSESGTDTYYWTDNSSNFRISTNPNHLGSTSGTVVGTQTSDERLKNVIGPVEYGLAEVLQLNPVKFAIKLDPDQKANLGFIAQQVNSIVPESVFDTKEEIVEGEPTKLGMEYVALIPVLVNAVKEQQAIIEQLKTRIEALEGIQP